MEIVIIYVLGLFLGITIKNWVKGGTENTALSQKIDSLTILTRDRQAKTEYSALSKQEYNFHIQQAGVEFKKFAMLEYAGVGLMALGTCVSFASVKAGLAINVGGLIFALIAPYRIYVAGEMLRTTTGTGHE